MRNRRIQSPEITYLTNQLFSAVNRGNVEGVKTILRKEVAILNVNNPALLPKKPVRVSVNARKEYNLSSNSYTETKAALTPLMRAVVKGDKPLATVLLEAGSDPNIVAPVLRRGIIWRHNGNNMEYVSALILTIDKKDGFDLDMVALLLRYGAKADVDTEPYPLHVALGRFEYFLTGNSNNLQEMANNKRDSIISTISTMITMLIAAGGKLGKVDEFGQNAVHRVASIGDSHSQRLLRFIASRATKTDLNKKDNTAQKAPLHYAADDVFSTRILIKAGANVNIRDRNQNTPLHDAAISYTVQTMRLLLRAGAFVNAKNKDGNTPLHLVSKYEVTTQVHEKIIDVLLKNGANPLMKNKKGRTPIDFARGGLKQKLKEWLPERGLRRESARRVLKRKEFPQNVANRIMSMTGLSYTNQYGRKLNGYVPSQKNSIAYRVQKRRRRK